MKTNKAGATRYSSTTSAAKARPAQAVSGKSEQMKYAKVPMKRERC